MSDYNEDELIKKCIEKAIPKKPIAHSISTWDSCTEILYKCPICGADFRILTDQVSYCFNCGQRINWNVKRRIDKPYTRSGGLNEEKEVIKKINEENKKE